MEVRVETIEELKRIRFSEFDKVFCRAKEKEYYLKNDAGLSPDDEDIIQAAHGSTFRWVAQKARNSGGGGGGGGYAPLDSEGKVPLANMPATVFTYKGGWDAATNSPSLSDGSGTSGDTYRVTEAGTVDFGSGGIAFVVGDKAVYNGATWEKWDVQDETVPVGTVIQTARTTAPAGYLACNGAAVSRTTYADLFSAIGTTYGVGDGSTTFTLPDLRGLFVRGAGAHGTMTKAAGGAFDGGSVGSTSNDSMHEHYHRGVLNNVHGYSGGGGISQYLGNGDGSSTTDTKVLQAVTDGTNGTPRTGNETKPASMSLLYCIKY